MGNNNGINILELPYELLKAIFDYLTFDEISKIRLVCKGFDVCSREKLNQGFQKSVIRYSKVLETIKVINNNTNHTNLILKNSEFFTTSLDITILDLTFKPYIRLKLCCFIPGKVIDELNRISSLILNNFYSKKEFNFTQEFIVFEAMHKRAIRHFVTYIVPLIERKQLEKEKIIADLKEELNSLRKN